MIIIAVIIGLKEWLRIDVTAAVSCRSFCRQEPCNKNLVHSSLYDKTSEVSNKKKKFKTDDDDDVETLGEKNGK